MDDDRWATILDRVQSQFTVIDQGKMALADVPRGEIEFIVFDSPLGRLKLERTTKPRVVDKKTFGGSKYGTAAGVEYVYSDTEMTHQLQAFKEIDGEWEPFAAEGLLS